jgi:hypothetical protein
MGEKDCGTTMAPPPDPPAPSSSWSINSQMCGMRVVFWDQLASLTKDA